MSAVTAPSAPLPPAPGSRPLSGWSIFFRLLLVAAITGTALVLFAAWSFLPRGDVRQLRRLALSHLSGDWHKQVELRVGGAICSVGQFAAAIAGAPAEAQVALGCLDSAEVSVHHCDSSAAGDASAGPLLAAAVTEMRERGWDPVVTVRDHGDTVAVFTRDDGIEHLRVCVLVLDGRDLVIATCRARPAPLLKLFSDRAAQQLAAAF